MPRRLLRLGALAFAAMAFSLAPCAIASPAGETAPPADPVADTTAGSAVADPVVNPIAHVEQRGVGPINMVLIPGSPSDWRVWDAFMTRNAERYTMYALTLAGFSGTPAMPMPDADTTSPTPWMDAEVDAIAQFIADRKLKDVVVVGHSLGGHLVLRLAIEHPDAAAKIIDVDGVPASNYGGADLTPEMRVAFIDSQLAPQLKSMDKQKAAAMFEGSAHQMVTDPKRGDELAAMFAATDQAIAMEYLLQGLKSDISNKMKDIKTPTLVIASVGQAKDNEAAREKIRTQWKNWTASVDAITLEFYEDSMHFVMDDQPKKLDESIENFLGVAAKPEQEQQ